VFRQVLDIVYFGLLPLLEDEFDPPTKIKSQEIGQNCDLLSSSNKDS